MKIYQLLSIAWSQPILGAPSVSQSEVPHQEQVWGDQMGADQVGSKMEVP